MTSSDTDTVPVLTIRQPGDLIEAVPYLLGFHPAQSLVVVGLAESSVSVTARLDLPPGPTSAADSDSDSDAGLAAGELQDVVAVLARSGSRQAVAILYYAPPASADSPFPRAGDALDAPLPYSECVARLADGLAEQNIRLLDALLVSAERYFSYLCPIGECCPPQGRVLPGDSSSSAATATYAGLVALPDRQAVLDSMAPHPSHTSPQLALAIAAAENAAMQAMLTARHGRHQNSLKREIFAAARRADDGLFSRTEVAANVEEIARYCVALGDVVVRDALWLAIDARRLDGSRFWLDLARRSPAPYSAAPYFLHAWAQWRAGNGTVARAAVEQALAGDPDYSAGWLLVSALDHGLDPRRTPRLRNGAPRTRDARRCAGDE